MMTPVWPWSSRTGERTTVTSWSPISGKTMTVSELLSFLNSLGAVHLFHHYHERTKCSFCGRGLWPGVHCSASNCLGQHTGTYTLSDQHHTHSLWHIYYLAVGLHIPSPPHTLWPFTTLRKSAQRTLVPFFFFKFKKHVKLSTWTTFLQIFSHPQIISFWENVYRWCQLSSNLVMKQQTYHQVHPLSLMFPPLLHQRSATFVAGEERNKQEVRSVGWLCKLKLPKNSKLF
jgi:hypothetical protein